MSQETTFASAARATNPSSTGVPCSRQGTLASRSCLTKRGIEQRKHVPQNSHASDLIKVSICHRCGGLTIVRRLAKYRT
jgi:hypothetical protein